MYKLLLILLLSFIDSKQFPIPNTGGSLDNQRSISCIFLQEDITYNEYLTKIDSIVYYYNQSNKTKLKSQWILRKNPWILNRLIESDYYHWVTVNEGEYDPDAIITLKSGECLKLPLEEEYMVYDHISSNISLDVNIPEYLLRVKYKDKVLDSFKIRVGRNEKKFLGASNRIQDLRTKSGAGIISKIELNPVYMNPVNGYRYFTTKRDDGIRTKLPNVPFFHLKINNEENGQIIHPTTNPNTLGKTYSNGCIGMSESDVWKLYSFIDKGTSIIIRYDLETPSNQVLPDIYDYHNNSTNSKRFYK